MKFEKYNANPKGIKAADCVIRAICTATDKSWEDTYKGLFEIGLKLKRVINEKGCYEKYLDKLGFEKCKMPRKLDNKRFTVEEFADNLVSKNKVYIISVAGHLTVIKNAILIDTWNCGKKSVGNYWVK